MFQIAVAPNTKCKLKLLRLERLKDFLAIEEEFLSNQESVKPREEKEQVRCSISAHCILSIRFSLLTLVVYAQEEKNKLEELRGTPLAVGNLEEIIGAINSYQFDTIS